MPIVILDAWRIWRRQEGVAAIEFALLAPLLIALIIGIVDLGMATYMKREAQAAAQAGAQFALIAGWEQADIAAATANSSTLDAPVIVVQRVWACALVTSLSFVAQGTACSGGTAGTYVRVTVDPGFTPILPLVGLTVAPAVAIVRIE